MIRTFYFLISFAMATVITACGASGFKHEIPANGNNSQGGQTGGGSGGGSNGEDLEQKAVGVLASNCAACHGVASSGGISGILDVPHLVEAGLIIPGNPNGSPIIQSVEANRMPKGGPALSASDKKTLRDWVAQKK